MFAACLFASAALALGVPTWKIIDPSISGTATGVAFTSDLIGYAAGGSNGAGPQIFKSTDAGVTWTTCPAQFGIDLLLLDLDATENTVVVSSVFGELYSDDAGASFSPSVGGGTSQSVRFLGINGDGGKSFGVTGQYGSVEGVGISSDGGKTFKTFDAKLSTEARYGAFPSDSVWYVAAGDWPNNSAEKRSRSVFMRGGKHFPAQYTPRDAVDGSNDDPGQYQAQITMTKDGGSTFTTVFNDVGNFYFNSIDCQPSNPDWCCAVGEADSDSPQSGARIHCTQDGGSTWNRTFYAPGTASEGFSLMEIAYATDLDVWALGGELSSIFPSAWFLYSSDGGVTWSHGTPPMQGYMSLGLSFPDAAHAWAALDNVLTQESAIAVYA